MTSPGEELSALRDRLRSGLAGVADRSRSPDWAEDDAQALGDAALGAAVKALYQSLPRQPSTQTVDDLLEELAQVMRRRRAVLIAVLLSPDEILRRVPGDEPGDDRADLERWFALCWLAEAAWRAVTSGTPGPGFADGDRDLLRPLAARLRFLALSEPLRHRPARAGIWARGHGHGAYGRAATVFGTRGWNTLVDRCREARHTWKGFFDAYESHPFLATALPGELEEELTRLIFAGDRHGTVLVVSIRPLSAPAHPNAEDRAVLADAVDLHLLPRFRLGKVISLGCPAPVTAGSGPAPEPAHELSHRPAVADPAETARSRRVLAALVLLAGLTAVAATALSWVRPAALAAALVAYVLIGAGAIWFDRAWTAMWLLRLPAASTVGFLVLITLPEDWWQRPTPLTAAPILASAAYGYLAIEARNHGVAPLAAIARAAAVWTIGAGHAFLVSLIGLAGVAPAFAANGSGLWSSPSTSGVPGAVLLLATSWCLAVGVFSQILWDDRPITAPLAHLRWRAER
jgi:hypothetical protein